ncbi:hypothetical protein N2152v2_009799 [Parachlorella kessleri]
MRQQGRSLLAVPAAATSNLATYHFPQQHSGPAADWFQLAVRDIVKHVDAVPFLQLVQLGGVTPKFTNLAVPPSVVPVPELWQGVAEHVTSSHPDVVILVQQVHPSPSRPAASRTAEGAVDQPWGHNDLHTVAAPVPGSPRRSISAAAMQQMEAAATRLVETGLAEGLLMGKVGDCCDGPEGQSHHHGHHHSSSGAHEHATVRPSSAASSSGRSSSSSAIVPFLAGAARRARAEVRTAALRTGSGGSSASECSKDTCYFGVVVQSSGPQLTGAEGCYLLKTVRNVSPTGCACTHFSLTRVGQGDLESQFVRSWLA